MSRKVIWVLLSSVVVSAVLPGLALASPPDVIKSFQHEAATAAGWTLATGVKRAHASNSQMPPLGGDASGETYATIAKLQASQAVLAERIKLAEEQRKLAELQQSIGALSSGGLDGGVLMQPGSAPLVLRVEGVPGALTALIEMPSGGLLRVSPGELYPDIGRVVAVTNMGVSVRHNGKTHVIEFASSAASRRDGGDGYSGGPGRLPGSTSGPPVPVSGPFNGQEQGPPGQPGPPTSQPMP